MCTQAGRCPAPPVTPPSSPDRMWPRSPSPPILPSIRRRRLWSPPMRRRRSLTKSERSKSSASSTAPRLVHHPRPPSPGAESTPDFRPPSRSRRQGHRSHHDSRPPSKTSPQSGAEDVRGRLQRRCPSPSPSAASTSPSTASTSPSRTPPRNERLQSALRQPPRTLHGNRGSRFVASTILSSARKRAQASPPSTTDIARINRKLRALAL